jgi:hypothetical protein
MKAAQKRSPRQNHRGELVTLYYPPWQNKQASWSNIEYQLIVRRKEDSAKEETVCS